MGTSETVAREQIRAVMMTALWLHWPGSGAKVKIAVDEQGSGAVEEGGSMPNDTRDCNIAAARDAHAWRRGRSWVDWEEDRSNPSNHSTRRGQAEATEGLRTNKKHTDKTEVAGRYAATKHGGAGPSGGWMSSLAWEDAPVRSALVDWQSGPSVPLLEAQPPPSFFER